MRGAHRVRSGRHLRSRSRRGDAARARDRGRRQLRGRVAQLARRRRPDAGSSARTSSARRRCSTRRAPPASRASTTSRRARCTGICALDTDDVFTEDSPYRPRTPYNASKAGADHAVRAYFETFGLPVTITNCSNNYGPLPVPGEGHPALHRRTRSTTSRSRCTRRRRTSANGCTSSTTAEAIDLVLQEGRAGRDVQRRLGSRGDDRGDRRSRARADRASRRLCKKIVPDRPGHDRRYLARRDEDLAGAGLGAGRAASTTGCARPSPGTKRIASGGSRSRSALQSKNLPGNRPVRSRPGAIGREHKELTLRSYPGALVRALVAATSSSSPRHRRIRVRGSRRRPRPTAKRSSSSPDAAMGTASG